MKFILSNQRIVVFGSTGMVGKAVLRALGREVF